jgi:hypothetical protein
MKFPDQITVVKWVDAKSRDDWHSREEAIADSLIDHIVISCGWILCEDKNYIVLLQSDSHDGKVAGWISVPKKWILEKQIYNIEKGETNDQESPSGIQISTAKNS